MLLLKYLLVASAVGLFAAAAAVLAFDLYRMLRLRLQQPEAEPALPVRWPAAIRLALLAWLPLLAGLSIVVVPTGSASVRLSQISGTLPGTLYPGTHFVVPLVQQVQTYNVRDRVYTAAAPEGPKQADTSLRLQTREGLQVGLGV